MMMMMLLVLTQTNKPLGAFARDIEYQAKRLPDEVKKMEGGKTMGVGVGEGEYGMQSLQGRSFGMRINCSRGWGMVAW